MDVMNLLLLTVVAGIGPPADVVLNEVCASNVDVLYDEDGDTPDWIEIHNPTDTPVNLGGYTLSDDEAPMDPWAFPPYLLQPDDYLLVFASGKDRREYVDHRVPVIREGDPWKYRECFEDLPRNWMSMEFDDADWKTGASGFGYGDNDDATTITGPSVACRTWFEATPDMLQSLQELTLHVDFDDAFVAWLNGVEIARDNIGAPLGATPCGRWSDEPREARLMRDRMVHPATEDDLRSLLRPGPNLLAVQVLNYSETSTDLSAIPMVTAGFARGRAGNPGRRLLLFPDYEFHLDFALKAEGETIGLRNAEGQLIDSIRTGPLPVDGSLGRGPDPTSPWLNHRLPTPGEFNSTKGLTGFGPSVQIDPPGGWFDGSTTISVNAPDSVEVRYSLDGSLPSRSDPLYVGPFEVTEPVTILRARAFTADRWPGPAATATFLIEPEWKLPVVSLTTDPDNLWDPDIGIYHENNVNKKWERPVHFEFFETWGERVSAMDAGIRIHGALGRIFAQKSFLLLARAGYSETAFRYRFFPEIPIDEFARLLLRNASADYCKGHMRDGVIQNIGQGLDLEMQGYRPCVVLLNGEYWGVLNLRERAGRHLVAEHRGVDADEIDLLEQNLEVIQGSADHYVAMLDYIAAHDLAIDAHFRHLQTLMDTENFATYVAFEVYSGNTDWPGNNIRYWRPQAPNGRWKWIIYDMDGALGGGELASFDSFFWASRALPENGFRGRWSTWLFKNLLRADNFRHDFLNRYADYLNSRFSTDETMKIIRKDARILDQEIKNHQERWSSNRGIWMAHVRKMRDFARDRPPYARDHVVDNLGLDGTWTLDLDIHPPGSGRIGLTDISISQSFSGTYFLNAPMTIRAKPVPGFVFDGWEGPVTGDAELALEATGDLALTARFVPGGSAVVLSEINYHSNENFDPGDWVELLNTGNLSEDLSGWTFEDTGGAFRFPDGTVIPGGGLLILAENRNTFQLEFPHAGPVLGDLGFGLSGGGERLALLDDDGRIIDEVHYGDSYPWPPEADGDGPTLELTQPTADNADPGFWRKSRSAHGSPGIATTGPCCQSQPQ